MFTRGKLPASNPHFAVRSDWPAYPDAVNTMPWLDDLQVRAIVAMEVMATKLWHVRIRQAPDEHIFFIHEGRGQVETRSGPAAFTAGDVLFWSRGDERCIQQDPEHPIRHTVIHLDATVGQRRLGDFVRLPVQSRLGRGHATFTLASEVARVCALQPPGWQQELDAIALRLLLCLMRDPLVIASSELVGSIEAAKLQPAIELMRRTLDDPSRLSVLAKRCGMSSAHFRRMFHQVFSCSPRTYLATLRVQEAKQRLITTVDTVDRIAQSVGFTNGASFSVLFRRHVGMTPGAFRRRTSVD